MRIPFSLDRVWVKATINNTPYLFDPAFKAYRYKQKIDLGLATGYSRNELLAAAAGSATITSDYVQNLNEADLNNKLVAYATNLLNTIRSQYPNQEVSEIIGGRSIVESNLDEYQGSLPFPTSTVATWDEIPSEYIATLRLQHAGIDHTFLIPEIAGKRLTITYAGSPELRLEGDLIAVGSPTVSGASYDMTLTVDHPYASDGGTFADQKATSLNVSGSMYAIVTDFGGIREELISKRQRMLDASRAEGLSDVAESVLGETLHIIGLTWLKEFKMTDNLIYGVSGDKELVHHRIGRVSQENTYRIDFPLVHDSIVRQSESSGMADLLAGTFVGSALEHGVLEQLIDTAIPAV